MSECKHEKFVRVFGQYIEGNYNTEISKDICLACGKTKEEIEVDKERDELLLQIEKYKSFCDRQQLAHKDTYDLLMTQKAYTTILHGALTELADETGMEANLLSDVNNGIVQSAVHHLKDIEKEAQKHLNSIPIESVQTVIEICDKFLAK